MRRRLILSTALIAFAAVVILGVPLAVVEATVVRTDSAGRLEREADGVSGDIARQIELGGRLDRRVLEQDAAPGHHVIYTSTSGRTSTAGPQLHGDVIRQRAGSTATGTVVVEEPAAELDRRVERVWLLVAGLGALGVLAAIVLAAFQARRLARPLEAIAVSAARLGDGDLSAHAARSGIAEVDAVAIGLNSSAGRIAALLAREREFSANVSHQLRTPLTALRLRLENAQWEHPDRSGELEAALAETDRLESTVSHLLSYAHNVKPPDREVIDAAAVAHRQAARWQPVFERAGREVTVSAHHDAQARASPGTVEHVVDVLLENALHHGRGAVVVDVIAGADAITIAVADEGAGVAAADRRRIFDRGASSRGGTGIGLHLARALVRADGGTLDLSDTDTTRFELRLPRVATPQRQAVGGEVTPATLQS